MTLGAITDVIDPTRKLIFIKAAGITAKLGMESAGVCIVKNIPPITMNVDNIEVRSGPLIATSNKAARD